MKITNYIEDFNHSFEVTPEMMAEAEQYYYEQLEDETELEQKLCLLYEEMKCKTCKQENEIRRQRIQERLHFEETHRHIKELGCNQ